MSRAKKRTGGRPDGQRPLTPVIRGRLQQLAGLAVEEVADHLTPRVLAPALAREAAELAVGKAMQILPGLAIAVGGGERPAAGPRELGGAMIGDEHPLLDLSRAVLISEVSTCEVDWARADDGNPPVDRTFALQVSGPIAGTRGADQAQVMLVADLEGLAAVMAHVLLLAERAGIFDHLWSACQDEVARMKDPRPTTPTEGA